MSLWSLWTKVALGRRRSEQTTKYVFVIPAHYPSSPPFIATQSFIVVRPPPAKSNHPLNLQVQLVPPQSRDRDRTRSIDISQPTQDQEDTILSRTSSNRSDVSMYSGYSSVTSFASVTSASTTSSRRMIIPLYNLQAHNVMTNIIVDAGTDAKVAKFQKRGLEILGLAILEPVEIFGANNSFVPQIPPSSNRTSIDDHQDSPLSPQFTPRPGGADGVRTPTSSAHSLSSGGMDNPSPSPPAITRPDNDSTPTTGTKKIFGKFFKKKDSQPPSPSPTSPKGNFILRPSRLSTGQSLAIPPQANSKRNSWLGPTNPGQPSELSTSPPSSVPTASQLRPATLGIHPSCSSPKHPPQGRPHSYTWVVRKWIKGSNGGLLDNVIGQLSLSDERRTPPEEGAVEVHFVWSRGKKKRKLQRDGSQTVGANRRPSVQRGSASSPNRSGTTDRTEKRLSTASGHSMSTASEVGSSAGRHARGGGGEEDDGDESEPEDSETPWTCTLVMSRVGAGVDGGGGAMSPAAAAAAAASDGGASTSTRVRVATLSPTPHHPKVVALLKVPFPLPDIIVDRLQVCRRAVSAQGIARPSWNASTNAVGGGGGDEPDGLVLTAEEIKDVVSSTGLWLVVREGIGGVGKISRKGDGWRIRA
jgi:hypothetical protein